MRRAVRQVVFPTLSFGDVDELRREQALLESKRVAEERWRAPKRSKRLRPGEEPSQYHQDGLFLHQRTKGH
jgi:hypothetical protein